MFKLLGHCWIDEKMAQIFSLVGMPAGQMATLLYPKVYDITDLTEISCQLAQD